MALSSGEQRLYDTLTAILTVGGGAIGATLGAPLGLGPGSPVTGTMGALGGAGLGSAAGKGIENFAKSMQGQPSSNADVLKAIPQGAAAEAGGQLTGKALSQLVNMLRVPVNTAAYKALPEIEPESAYHGSSEAISSPALEFTQHSSHGPAYYSTPNLDLAQHIARNKTESKIMKGLVPEYTSPAVSEYVQPKLPEGSVLKIQSMDDIHKLAKQLGVSDDEISKIDYDFIDLIRSGFHPAGSLDATYMNVRKALANNSPDFEMGMDLDKYWGDKLKGLGYQKIEKPYAGFALTENPREIVSFDPEKQLMYKPHYEEQLAKNEQVNKQLAGNAKLDDVNRLVELLSKAVAAKGVQNVGKK